MVSFEFFSRAEDPVADSQANSRASILTPEASPTSISTSDIPEASCCMAVDSAISRMFMAMENSCITFILKYPLTDPWQLHSCQPVYHEAAARDRSHDDP